MKPRQKMVLNNRTTVFKREDYVKGKKCGFDTKFLNQSEKKNQKRGTWMAQALGWRKHPACVPFCLSLGGL
jgi:hypothetical protein